VIRDHHSTATQPEHRADVVVIGTGAGGAAAGAELAEAGLDVVFVEEGSYFPTSSFSPYVEQSAPRLYRDTGGTVVLGTPNITFLEGRCVGGSTVINGGMTWRTPEKILDEWVALTGDDTLGPAGMEPLFQRVEERIHAKYHVPEAVGDDNRIMALGAKKLGWEYLYNQRNQDHCVGANSCVLGCPTGAKRSTLVSYMPRALAHGARVLTEVRAERLLIEGGRAVGVVGRSVDPRTRRFAHTVTVRAQAVVVAAGSIQTPYLLLGHRALRRRARGLGKHLLTHPNVKVTAVYPFEVKGWQGLSQLGQTRAFRDDGILLAENMIGPGPMAAQLHHHGAAAWEFMSRYQNMVLTGALIEDSTTGVVKRGPFGLAVPKYDSTPYDHERYIKGVKLLAELHFAMGAEYVTVPFAHRRVLRSPDELGTLTTKTIPLETIELFTVHLMGTARMGSTREGSVVDLDGQLWELPGCYVADASVFPTAIGVNPQVTIMALATRVAHRLAERLSPHRAAA